MWAEKSRCIIDNLLFENILFLLLFRSRQAHWFLPLVVHHLLHHPAGLSIQVWQLLRRKENTKCGLEAVTGNWKISDFKLRIKSFLTLYLWVLWTDFLGVYFWIGGDNSAPPLHFIDLELKKVMRLGISFIHCGELCFKISVLLFPSGLWRPCRRRWARSSPPPWSRCKAGPPGREGVPSGPPSVCGAGCPRPHPCP